MEILCLTLHRELITWMLSYLKGHKGVKMVPPVSLSFSQLMVSMTRGTRESVLEKGYGLSTQKEDATLPPSKGEMLGIVDP